MALDDAVADALRRGRGVEGAALGAVLAYEHGAPPTERVEAVTDLRAGGTAYHEALAWTQTVTTGLARRGLAVD